MTAHLSHLPAAEPYAVSLGIDRFLYDEAALLDEGRYQEWLALLTDDIRYFAPQAEFSNNADPSLDYIGAHHFDEDRRALENRVEWLDSGLNHSEIPPSLKTRLISNIRVLEWRGGEAKVGSNFLIFQARWDGSSALFAGRRVDMLRGEPGTWRLASRIIYLSMPVLPRSLTLFF